ncbi:hypothetical protein OAT04_01685 [Candidatus Pelagibacter sp.]|jgi:hypothetical protein|nr:hypothetical protein [Candidatus Pelagibacter sp.]
MKQIIKKFNNLVKRTIFKVENKTNNNFNISTFNKNLIFFVGLLFFYLFYLLIPLLYDKTWVQTNVESKLQNEFKINLSTSANISYRILPAPHFLIKDSKILVPDEGKQKSIAEIKDFKIFLNQRNFFDKKKMNIKKIVISNANFSLLRSDLKLLNELTDQNFSNKRININDSNIFFKDSLEEVISIIKINKLGLFFDDEKLYNFLNLKGKIFNVPFVFEFISHNESVKYKKINFSSKSLKLDILNKSTIEKKLISGENNISFLESKINTKYSIKEKLITFKSNDLKSNYTGELSINPFDLNFNIYLDNYKISKIFNINPILIEFIKSGLLFNDNISVNSSIIINSNLKNEIFQNAKINFHIINGKIHFDKTKFINDKIGSLQFTNSNLFYKNNELVFNSDLLIDIKNSKNLFSLLNTNKSSRKDFKTILLNLDYNFLTNRIKFNNLKIDNNDTNEQFLTIINDFNIKDLNNPNKGRRMLNDLLKAYVG